MHAVQGENKEGGGERQWKSGKEVITQTTSFLSLFTLSPCLTSPMSFPLSLYLSPLVHSPFSLPLSPQRNPASPLGLKLFEGDPELYCSLPLLSSLSSLPPALHPLTSLYPPLPPISPQGAWILLNREQPCSKSRPGLSAPAAGLAGCPTAPQRDGEVGGLGREEQGEGGGGGGAEGGEGGGGGGVFGRGRGLGVGNMRGAGCFRSRA